MVTEEKVRVYERYSGDADAWARSSRSDRDVLNDDEWVAITELLARLSLEGSGDTAKSFDDETDAMLKAASSSDYVARELTALAASLREGEIRRVVLPFAYRLIGPLFIFVPFLFWFFVRGVENRPPAWEERVGYAALFTFGVVATWQYERKATVSAWTLTFAGFPRRTTVMWIDIARVELGRSWFVVWMADGRTRKLSSESLNADWLCEQIDRRSLAVSRLNFDS